ncbi:OmpA family protein [Piscirickettsia litoralis]|uniref:OmpA family protein n=1 Tax=Piscirickettsia litoralis TaxID=1891921 RepID=UPI000B17FD11|nr:OmpA family protein [Piscirickettsia litoralis]
MYCRQLVWRQVKGGRFFVTPSIGAGWFDSDRQVSDEPVLNLSLGYNITDNVAVALSYAHSGNKDDVTGNSASMNQMRIDGLYRFMAQSRFQPYLLAGIGRQNLKGSNSFLDYGAGLTYDFMPNVALDVGVRRQYQLGSDNRTDTIASVGIQFSFGPHGNAFTSGDNFNQSETAPAPAPEKAAVAPAPKVATPPVDPCMVPINKIEINFASASDKISSNYDCKLGRIAAFLKDNPKSSAMIKGYADSSGNPNYNNEGLSQRRAERVKDYLVTQKRGE